VGLVCEGASKELRGRDLASQRELELWRRDSVLAEGTRPSERV
jgi:hypothetical protein